jgi:hypothetical protein
MFGMLSKFEINADGTEDVLLQTLALAMRSRGFNLLGIVAIQEEDGSLATFGDVSVTQSPEFAAVLRSLADQIDLNMGEAADVVIPSA